MKSGVTLRRHAAVSVPAARPGERGLSLIEVLVALSILTVGMLTVLALVPSTLRANERAELSSLAAAFAVMKVEEIRRDADAAGTLISSIEGLSSPTGLVVFPLEPRLAYQYHSESLLYTAFGDPRAASGVARVIVSEAPSYSPDPAILAEIRFDASLTTFSTEGELPENP